jgi:hypothetical protein
MIYIFGVKERGKKEALSIHQEASPIEACMSHA